MSFTTKVKDEITRLEFSKSENIAELSAFLRSNAKIEKDKIEIITENAKVAKRIYLLIYNIYQIKCAIDEKKKTIFNKSTIYVITISEKINNILVDLSIVDENSNYLEQPKDYIIDSEEEKKAYLRGTFLAHGSINDPKTSSYHLEFLYDEKMESVFVQRMLNQFDLNSKIIIREFKYMIYIKDSEKISDFLKLINAYQAVLYYENIKIVKEQKNATNRLNNCEQANIDKMIHTCNMQIEDIKKIEQYMGLEMLDEKIQEACKYRLKYPESSLTELSEIISLETNKKITKSGLNHRFRKIREIASKIKEN